MNIRSWLKSVIAACSLSAVLSPAFAADQPAGQAAQPNVLAEFNIAKRGDVIVLPVTVGERSYPFLLSVASHRMIADSRLRPLLGKRIERSGDQDDRAERTIDEFPAIPMRIGELAFTPQKPIICRDLRRDREFLGHDIHGIVGMDFLKDRVVQIDFDEGKLRILAEFARPVPRGTAVKSLWDSENGLTVDLEAPGGIAEPFAVDTTFLGAVAVGRPLARDLVAKGLIEGPESPAPLLKALTLGDWTHKNLLVVENTRNRVGLGFLSRFQLTFEFRENALFLSPGARFNQPVEFNWSVMDLLLKNGEVTVVNVGKNFPAASAGIQPGDVLIEANGKPARESSLFEIRRLFMEQKPIRVKFRRPEQESRGPEEFTVTFGNPTLSKSREGIIPTGGTDDSKP